MAAGRAGVGYFRPVAGDFRPATDGFGHESGSFCPPMGGFRHGSGILVPTYSDKQPRKR